MKVVCSSRRVIGLYAVIATAFILFRNTLQVYLGPIGSFFGFGLVLFSLPMLCAYLVGRPRVRVEQLVCLIYLGYLLLLVVLYPVFNEVGTPWPAFVGLFNLILVPMFWIVVFLYSDPETLYIKVQRLLLFIGALNATGALLQYFISPDLFGMISHHLYSDESSYDNSNFTRRAISFVSSPQALSLFLGFCLCLSNSIVVFRWRVFYRALLFLAGLLTFSKAFIVFLGAYFLYKAVFGPSKSKIVLLLGALVIVLPLGFIDFGSNRVFQIVYFVTAVSNYPAYPIWEDSFLYASEFPYLLFGHGVGVMSRGGQQMGGYLLLDGSAESFIIQLYLEAGIIGIALYFMFVGVALTKGARVNLNVAACVFAGNVVAIFSPALYGFTCGVIYYFLVTYLLFSERVYSKVS